MPPSFGRSDPFGFVGTYPFGKGGFQDGLCSLVGEGSSEESVEACIGITYKQLRGPL